MNTKLELFIKIYLTITPVTLGGIANMIFVKSPLLAMLKTPIDGSYLCADGKPLFGRNKTWKGALGMIFFTALAMLAFHIGFGERISYWTFYSPGPYQYLSPLADGALMGFAYIAFELPNSFVKRRIDINPGTSATGPRGWFFTLIDQADSTLGCALALLFITPIGITNAALLLIVGTINHPFITTLLYLAKLKKQAR